LCLAAPGARCRSPRNRSIPSRLHAARGWHGRKCPNCKVAPGEQCLTPSDREASRPHAARLHPGRHELFVQWEVWDELERRGATVAVVPFSGRAGSGGKVGKIALRGRHGDQPFAPDDELAFALAAPIWDRYGSFAGHPALRGSVTWTLTDRRIVIAGNRGGESFEEFAT
jgi:hypothetical protein